MMKYINNVPLILVVWCCLFKDNFVQSSVQEEKKNYKAEFQDVKLFQNDDAVLPKIFNADETETCPEDHYYCKMNIKLLPVNPVNTSLLWKAIEKVNTEDEIRYRRDVIYRGFCVGFNDSQKQYKGYIKDGIDGSIFDSYCVKEKNLFELLDAIDIILLIIFACYCSLVIYCTTKRKKSSENVFIEIFSIKNTWQDLQKPIKNEDHKNLLFIQGIRIILCIYVILIHNLMLLTVVFSHNPEYMEDFYFHPIKRTLTGSFGLLIEIFFVISSWMHAINLCNVAKTKTSFTMRDAFVMTLNRYFRLMPLMIICMLSQKSGLSSYVLKPLHQSHYTEEITRCMNGWWKNLLLIQNLATFGGQAFSRMFVNYWQLHGRQISPLITSGSNVAMIFENIRGPSFNSCGIPLIFGSLCMPHSWSVAADTQLFILSTIAFYLSRKFNISLKYFAAVAICGAVSTQAYTMLTSGYGGLFHFFPGELPMENLFISPDFLNKYYSTMNHVSSYVIGFGFGFIYLEHKEKIIFDTLIRKVAWFVAFFILPILTSFSHSLSYSKHSEFLMALTLRPVFAFGFAVGFLGLATNTGGFIRNFLQWKPLVFLANFNYSIYVFHLMVLVARVGNITKMVVLSNTFYLANLTADIITCSVVGIMLYFFIEHPCNKLMKRFLPQIVTSKKKL